MPRKKDEFNIKEWLLEQQRAMNAINKQKKNLIERQKGKSKAVSSPSKDAQYLQWMQPEEVLKRFPTSSGELYWGPCPSYKMLAKLRDIGVDTIWNLGRELAVFVQHEKAYVPHVIHGDIGDYDIPDNGLKFLKQVRQIAVLLNAGLKVFLHCAGGVGRSSMALASLDIVMNGTPAKQALQKANAYAHGPDTEEQHHFVKQLAHYLKTGKPMPEPEYSEYSPYDDEEIGGVIRPRQRVSIEPQPKQSEIDKIISRYEQPKQDVISPDQRGEWLEYLQQQRDAERLENEKREEERIKKRLALKKRLEEAKKKPN
jgi:hypothetical protein